MPIDVEAAVLANTRLSYPYNIVTLEAPAIAQQAQPGQFVMVKTTPGNDPLLRRPFSIFEILRDASGAPSAITLLNKVVGRGTGLLHEVNTGERLGCLGPLGVPFVAVDPPAVAWMVAGGVGLAPFATLAEELRSRGTASALFYGGRSAMDLLKLELFQSLGVALELTTEDGSRGVKGFVTRALEARLEKAPPGTQVTIYVCGPTPMMRAVAKLARRFNRPCHVSLEQVMGCGLGGCYSCVVPVARNGRLGEVSASPAGALAEAGHSHFVRSCIDGPVFDAARIVWDDLEGH